MAQEQYAYTATCEVCEVAVLVIVVEEDEPPHHCPLCGEQTFFENDEN